MTTGKYLSLGEYEYVKDEQRAILGYKWYLPSATVVNSP